MKKKLLLLFSILAMAVSASAYDFDVDDIYYNITSASEPYTCAVTYRTYDEENYSYSSPYSGDFVIPSTVTYNDITYSVTSIGESAFAECFGLKSVTIPNSVTSIGKFAFYYCDILTSVVIPNSVASIGNGAFVSCSCLTSVTIPNSVKTIGESAFSDCSSLTSVTIPNSVTSIGKYAFAYCSSLTEIISLATTPPSLGSYVFSEIASDYKIKVPGPLVETYKTNWSGYSGNIVSAENMIIRYTAAEQVTPTGVITGASGALTILSHTYDSGTEEGTIIFSGDVTSIGDNSDTGAFMDCPGLTSVVIPNSVTSIGNYAFHLCPDLTSVEIPNSVTSISMGAFQDCSSLTSVTIGNSVTTIGDMAFSFCSNLAEITSLRETPPSLGMMSFSKIASGCKLIVPTAAAVTAYSSADDWSALSLNILSATRIIRYTASAQVTPNATGVFGATYKSASSTYDKATGKGMLVFDGDVTTIGEDAFCDCIGLTSVTIPNSVTSIGKYAFAGCGNLTSVVIPNSVTSIGNSAFCDCESLTSVVIPNSVTSIENETFYGCKRLADVVIPETVISIGDLAFCDCIGLTSVTIPNSVTSIGEGAFGGCKGLKSVKIDGSVNVFGEGPFDNCTNLESFTGNLASTDNRCLIKNNELIAFAPAGVETYAIPITVTSIGSYVFMGCSGLTSVEIPNSVISIGSQSFDNCTNLTTIISLATTPPTAKKNTFNGVDKKTCKVIVPNADAKAEYNKAEGWNAFTNILNAENMIIRYRSSDENAVEPKEGAFKDASGNTLTFTNTYDSESKEWTITFDGEVTEIGNNAFDGCSSLTSVTIPNSVTTIGNYAFYNTGLTTVDIPTYVTTIGTQAFTSCHKLASFTGNFASDGGRCLIVEDKLIAFAPAEQTEYSIPSGVKTIGQGAFFNFTNLTSVTIPESVTDIETNAFASCSGLTSLTVKNSNPATLGQTVFSGVNTSECILNVPNGSKESYSTAKQWKEFKNIKDALADAKTEAKADLASYKDESAYREAQKIELAKAITAGNKAIDDATTTEGVAEALASAKADIDKIKTDAQLTAEAVTLVDGKDYTGTENMNYVDVTYTRTFSSTDWQPLYVPFNMSYEEWSEYGTVAELACVHVYEDGNTAIEFVTVNSGELLPNVPYVIKPKKTGDVTFTCTDKQLKAAPAEGTKYISCSSPRYIFNLFGNYQSIDASKLAECGNAEFPSAYVMTEGNKFAHASDDTTLNPYRFYITREKNTNGYWSAPARYKMPAASFDETDVIYFMVDGLTTGILNVSEDSTDDVKVYNLNGIQTQNPHNGVFIKNGKKVYIK